jgi:hypothetical protein
MTLDKRAIHRATARIAHRIECLSGALWITHDGDRRDITLSAGERHVVDRDAPLLVFALEAAVFRIVAPG